MVHVQQTASWSDRLTDRLAQGWRRLPEPWRHRLVEAVTAHSAVATDQHPTTEQAAAVLSQTAAPRPAAPEPVAATAADESSLPYFRLREQDVRSGYRLLLHRDPTAPEINDHLHKGSTNLAYDIYHFIDVLLASPERERALADLSKPTPGSLDGMTFYYRPSDTSLGAWAAYYHAYETEVGAVIDDLLPPGGTFVDIGANIGLHTIRAARRVGPSGLVLSFEPSPQNVEILRLTLTANRFEQVTILTVAASDRAGSLPFHAPRGHSNGTCRSLPTTWPSDLQIDVPTVRLDEELGFLDHIDLLKIDIEGAEPLAFAGMTETLARLKPRLLLEFFPAALVQTSGTDPAEFLATVESLGYKLHPFLPGEGQPDAVYTPEAILPLPEQYGVTHIDILAEPC